MRISSGKIVMIQVSEIAKRYKKNPVLKDVSFEARPGEMVALIGKNGAGKSTLMHILSGMQRPDSGTICYFGQTMGKRRSLFGKYCGYVPQSNGLMEELSVQDNISLWTGKSGKPDERLMQMFRLESILQMPVKRLSGGMKRRVAVACAMANFPPILLMDEPTAALDQEYRDMLHRFMTEYTNMNGILVTATHDEREIAMADSVLILEDGHGIQRRKKECKYGNEI